MGHLINHLKYGEPAETAELLEHAMDLDEYDVTAALIGALRRIARLEKEVERLEARVAFLGRREAQS